MIGLYEEGKEDIYEDDDLGRGKVRMGGSFRIGE